jgi:anti-sigma factor RsiW
MTDRWTERLSEYLDGDLAPELRDELEAHLSRCDECLTILDELRGVVARGRALDDRPPEADLWRGIGARIGTRAAPESGVIELPAPVAPARRRLSLSIGQLLAACLAAMVISGSAVWLAVSRGPLPPTGSSRVETRPGGFAPSRVAGDLSPAAGSVSEARVANFADVQYESAVADLERVLHEGRGRLDPATLRTLEESLAVIDAALDQARRGVEADPGSIYLNEHLAATMRRKLGLLRRANALAQPT